MVSTLVYDTIVLSLSILSIYNFLSKLQLINSQKVNFSKMELLRTILRLVIPINVSSMMCLLPIIVSTESQSSQRNLTQGYSYLSSQSPTSDQAIACLSDQPPTSDQTIACISDQPPTSDQTIACISNQPPKSDQAIACLSDQSPSSDEYHVRRNREYTAWKNREYQPSQISKTFFYIVSAISNYYLYLAALFNIISNLHADIAKKKTPQEIFERLRLVQLGCKPIVLHTLSLSNTITLP